MIECMKVSASCSPHEKSGLASGNGAGRLVVVVYVGGGGEVT